MEVAWVHSRFLITGRGEQAIVGVDGEDGDSIFLQPVAGIQEASVGTEVNVGTATGRCMVGGDALYLCQVALVVGESCYLARQFADEVGKVPVGTKGNVSGA